jgi:beta-glucosidase
MQQGRTYALKVEFFRQAPAPVAQAAAPPAGRGGAPGAGGAGAFGGGRGGFGGPTGPTLAWEPALNNIDSAVAAAKQADAVVAVVGITRDLEGEEMNRPDMPEGFAGGDRTSLDLPKDEEALIEAMKATGKPLVVVLMNGSALSVNWASQNANAILEAWYPGEEGGTAVGEILSGAYNPSGRLPITFYKLASDLPPFTDYSMKGRTYRYFEGTPLYPFGYGLSYSKFAYSNLKLSTTSLKAGAPLQVDVDVRNTSRIAGGEVAQVYLVFPQIPGAPLRALRGFQRADIAPGDTQHLKFTLNPRDLSCVNESGDRLVAAGAYKIFVGGGQPGTGAPGAQAQFSITGEQKLPE